MSLAFVFSAMLVLCAPPVRSQAVDSGAAGEELRRRVRELETQMEALREELRQLKQTSPPSASDTAPPQSGNAVAATTPKVNNASAPALDARPAAKQAGQAAPERRLPGFELGAVRAVPYGTIYFNAFGNGGGTNNADVPLFATPAGTSGGGVSASVRQTRLGLRLQAPNVLGANLTGVIEADFFGGFPAVGIGENFGVVRVRLASARLDWERTSLTVGQDWMVFAPNNPTSIAAAGIPQLAAAGNLWARLPQIKVERRRGTRRQFILQGAVLTPATGDFPPGVNSPALLQFGVGAASRVPFLQARAAFVANDSFGTGKPGGVGLSAHYGRAQVTAGGTSRDLDSIGVALDWNAPIFTGRLTTSGELFVGRNLAGFQGGIFQGYNADFAYLQGGTLLPAGARAAGTRGGWSQLGLTPPIFGDRLTAYASFGLDDPRDEDFTNAVKRDFRTRNAAYAFNFLYKLTPQLTWGLEFRRLRTAYLLGHKEAANHLNLGAAFNF